jgi:hypothetical protein
LDEVDSKWNWNNLSISADTPLLNSSCLPDNSPCLHNEQKFVLSTDTKNLGNPEITAEVKQTITQGVLREAGNRSVEQLAQEESDMLLGLLRIRAGPGRT